MQRARLTATTRSAPASPRRTGPGVTQGWPSMLSSPAGRPAGAIGTMWCGVWLQMCRTAGLASRV